MGLFSFIKNQLIEVIEWVDESNDTLIWKFPDEDKSIKMGAQLTVRESQVAIFLNEGKLADVFPPGRHELSTRNMPILTSLKSWKYGFDSPFRVDIYFVSTREFNLGWGTPSPISYSDDTFFAIDLRAHGNLYMQVTDGAKFFRSVAGTDPHVTTEECMNHLRGIIVDEFSLAIGQSNLSVRDLLKANATLGPAVLPVIKQNLDRYGIQANRISINVKLPEEITKELQQQDMAFRDKSRMGNLDNQLEMQNLMGRANLAQNVDTNKFMQFQAGATMGTPGSGGSGMGDTMRNMMEMGMGMNMANQMMQGMQQQPQQQAQQAAGAGAAMSRDEVMKALKDLGELKQMGILTDDEFNAKKAELLAKL